MKIAIIAEGRTGSNYLCSLLSKKFKLTNDSDTVTNNRMSFQYYDYYNTLNSRDNFVLKHTATTLTPLWDVIRHGHELTHDYTIIDWSIYDYIIILSRKNLYDQISSWMLGNLWTDVEFRNYYSDFQEKQYSSRRYSLARYIVENNITMSDINKNRNQTDWVESQIEWALTRIYLVRLVQKYVASKYTTHELNSESLIYHHKNLTEKFSNIFQVDFTREDFEDPNLTETKRDDNFEWIDFRKITGIDDYVDSIFSTSDKLKYYRRIFYE
ncbi:MAG: hypothetical protein VW683_00145 [Betaproteobacteria bacterium]|jgi:hypothetical protein